MAEEVKQEVKVGWMCPVCGVGVAPWMATCPCRAPRMTIDPDQSPHVPHWIPPVYTGDPLPGQRTYIGDQMPKFGNMCTSDRKA